MPNLIAYAALALWPAVSAVLFARLPPGRAVIACLLAGYLLLPPPPAMFDLPLVPALTKDTIPALAALALCLLLRTDPARLLPAHPLARLLVAVYLLVPIGTVLTNGDPVFWGAYGLPGLRPQEAIGMMIAQAITLIPFLLGRALLCRPEDHRDLLVALVIAGLVYSLPMLVEVRLSPQINVWVYGYFQHLFEQMVRGGGYRPIVFLYHGLWAAFFLMTTVIAAAGLVRGSEAGRAVAFGAAALYLLGVLVLCKSYAALFYAAAGLALLLFLKPAGQLRLAVALALFALAYPVAKGAGLVPEAQIVELAARLGEDRAHSLQFRFLNETILAERAAERPLFGWGLYSRNHIVDPYSGALLTVTDGRWILVLGLGGWLALAAEFGLLALPLILALYGGQSPARRQPGNAPAATGATSAGPVPVGAATGTLALILGINLFDLIPNATITPITWLFAGAILGWAEAPRPAVVFGGNRPIQPIRTVL